MHKILSIVGPTATGKTSFALWIAEHLLHEGKVTGVDIISADSRQVYRELAIISGADVPARLPRGITVHGVGVITIDDDWSVAHFRDFALPIIEKSVAQNRLPFIVGGTGLYHRHLFNYELAEQPGPNVELRRRLQTFSVTELQGLLGQLYPERLASMNDSDRQNARRLIRAIEQAQTISQTKPSEKTVKKKSPPFQVVTLGLSDSLTNIETKISQRVLERWQNGAVEEVKQLQQKMSQDRPAFSATGVKEIQLYLDGKLSEEAAQQRWVIREFQYAKRQLTWWKKEPTVQWFLVDELKWRDHAAKAVKQSIF